MRPRLVRLDETASTQDVARRLAEEGAPDGTAVWALRQTAGRGRMGRRWRSGDGGLYFSVVRRPRIPPSGLAALSLALGDAAARVLTRASGVETAVKPPNDVLARCPDGRLRKLAGILCEASGTESGLDWLVVGIGVNVNNVPPLKRATGLRALTGRRLALEPLLRALLRAARRA